MRHSRIALEGNVDLSEKCSSGECRRAPAQAATGWRWTTSVRALSVRPIGG
jgi:hypothetical protein